MTLCAPQQTRLFQRNAGLTIIELVIVFAIIAVLSGISIPVYRNYAERHKQRVAIADIHLLAAGIQRFETEYNSLPPSLNGLVDSVTNDPWGRPYQYLNMHSGDPDVAGKRRKDKNLVPINSDYDLYSKGPDGESTPPLTAAKSRDDIIRANDGAYVGIASDY
jgi:general secretion pathway protein G